MITREILIANTKTQKRERLESSATTLGELKAEMEAAGIDYSGMTFTEGISKTQLLNDDTQLPQNVRYHGQETNNLVILLTNTKKNIASGAMSRKEAYQAIKDHDLQDEVREEFGRNYTQVPTSDLEVFINNNVDSSDADEVEIEDTEDEEKEDTEDYNANDDEEVCSLEDLITDIRIESLENSLFVHIAQLACNKALEVYDVMDLQDDLSIIIKSMKKGEDKHKVKYEPVSTSDGLIGDDDIDDMINSL